MSLHARILRTCLRRPTSALIRDDQRAYRGIDLIVASFNLASIIESRSTARAVGVLLPTGGLMPIAALASWITGRAVVPLNYLLARSELEFVIGDCGADTIITAGPMLEFLGYEPAGAALVRLETLPLKGVPEPRWPCATPDSKLAALLYTSGTSGRPKGVELTHANILANANQVAQRVSFTRRDTMLGVLPQFHSFGFTVLTMLPLLLGMRAVYTARFIPNKLIRMMRNHRPSVFVGIPSMFAAMLRVKDASAEDFASLRFIISGGEPLPRAVADSFADRFGQELCEGYGLTETAPVTHVCLHGDHRPGSVGRPLPGVCQRIVDLDLGTDLLPGNDGEIHLAGPNVFRGYHHLPQETAEAFDGRGYFRTGDIGRVDAQGYLWITGRHKEMMIVAGENVFPREIEEVLNRHPSVAASGVTGIIDPVRGEVPIALIELDEGASLDETAILSFCREHLAGYKVPKQIQAVDELPRNPTGKIVRRQLAGLLEQAAPAD